ncbi:MULTISPECIES: zinc ribbon domain-containing protein [Halorubrum]|uniref:zinc ribbon domain-containing protein n=1 Tax=Halorubrum TaxID=56688 RepID=UPI000B788F42|nr:MULTISPECIES: zinc ribbon domain-containing protein [Halorubrum]MDB2239575.1 zinc ribbon domain-containing protein [Halorubrum ezzemoulense]TKX74977.1 zinc ribbon domain-containing protein [Halorubrum sp. GN11_10-6_MGM]
MGRVSLSNNPLLAALLGTVVTGLGHLYLRRWLRALGWLGLTVAASVLFLPASTISALSSGTLTDPFSILPIVLISAASVLDAYLIAKVRRQPDRFQANTVGSTGADESPACPACGKPVDPDLGFCHWCTTEFNVVDVSKLERIDENQSD